MGLDFLMNVNGGCGRSPWSVTNLCPVVLLWPLRDIWMYVWLPGPALFSRPVLYVFFLILGCTSGKRLPSTPQYVPQWHFTCVLVRVFASKWWMCVSCRWIEITKNATDQTGGAKMILRIKLQETNHDGRLDSPSHGVLMTFCALILWS